MSCPSCQCEETIYNEYLGEGYRVCAECEHEYFIESWLDRLINFLLRI